MFNASLPVGSQCFIIIVGDFSKNVFRWYIFEGFLTSFEPPQSLNIVLQTPVNWGEVGAYIHIPGNVDKPAINIQKHSDVGSSSKGRHPNRFYTYIWNLSRMVLNRAIISNGNSQSFGIALIRYVLGLGVSLTFLFVWRP